MLGQKTVNALLNLKASGPQSFEDLLRELLSNLTGQPYYLCSSGWQGGVDGVSRSGSIGFEAKRYGETDLDVRSLQGEIVQATRERPDLELWIVATTRRLSTQDRKQLNDTAEERGIALLILAADDLTLSFHSIAGLCATLPARVCEVLADPTWHETEKIRRSKKASDIKIDEVRVELEAIAASSDFASFRSDLEQTVRELPTWKAFVERHNQRMKRMILSNSKIEFGTHFDRDQVIPRTVKAQIGEWFAAASTSHQPNLGVLLGERFDGKTWVVFDWLVDRLDTLSLPVFFLGSSRGDSLTDLDTVLLSEVERSLGSYHRHAKALLDRHGLWAAGRTPWCLLILDGLNEYKSPGRPRPWQRHLSDAFARSQAELRPGAVLCTVRTKSWPDLEDDARHLAQDRVRKLPVGAFDDTEFAEALRRAGHAQEAIASLPEGAQRLIRRPRFLQLVLDHWDRLGNFEAVNEDVLYWLDVTDKLRGDRSGTPEHWDEERYQGVLLDLARKSIERHALNRSEIFDSLKTQIDSDVEVGFEQLDSEGVLDKSGLKFTVRLEHLRTGMGLLLIEILDNPSYSEEELRERLRDILSPFNEDDIATAWLRRASVFALLSESRVSERVTDILVDEWLRSRNRPPDDFEQVKTLEHRLLRPLLRLAPRTWTRSTGHYGLQELSILIFSEALAQEKSLIQQFARAWCRIVPQRGPSYVEDNEDTEETVRKALQDQDVAKLRLTAQGDSGILRLQNVAFYLESLYPGLLEPDDFLSVLATHHIPFYYLSDSGPWILRRGLAETPREWFEGWVQLVPRDRKSLLGDIVHHLLLLVHRADLEDLTPMVVPPQAAEEEDPFRDIYAFNRAHYEEVRSKPLDADQNRATHFLKRARPIVIDPQLPPPGPELLLELQKAWQKVFADTGIQLDSGSTREDHLFRDALPAVAAWMPEEGAAVVRRQMEDLPRRFRENQHWWVLSIRRHAVLAEGQSRTHLAAAAKTSPVHSNARIAPGYALLTLLPGMTSSEAVNAILSHTLEDEWGVLYHFLPFLDTDELREACLEVLERDNAPRERIRAYFMLTELEGGFLSENHIGSLHEDLESADSELRVATLGVAVSFEVHDLPPHALLMVASDKEEDRRTFAPRYAAWLLIQDGHFLNRLSPYWRSVAAVQHPARREEFLQEVESVLKGEYGEEDLSLAATYTLPDRVSLKPTRESLSMVDEDHSLLVKRSESSLGGLDESKGVDSSRMQELFNQDLHIDKWNRLIEEGVKEFRRRQEEHKTAWSFEQFPQELVDLLEKSRFEHWAETLLRNEDRTWFDWMGLVKPLFRRALRQGHGVALKLWNFVNPYPHQQGPSVIRYLDRGIDWVLHELSKPQADNTFVRCFLEELILDARTDLQLFEMALGARCQEPARLLAVAGKLLESQDPEVRARATRLLGWLEGTEERLRKTAQSDASLWVRRIAEQALDVRQREVFARHWLSTFLRQDLSRERRWGAGQLFLETVDGSFEAWAFRFVHETAPDTRTRGEAILLLQAARDEVKRERQPNLKKYFLGTQVSDLESGCHPWQRRRSWHELEGKF